MNGPESVRSVDVIVAIHIFIYFSVNYTFFQQCGSIQNLELEVLGT